ncbi:hypothetical protein ACJ2A9_07910 [Anaerobacillus sp. MEB173]|uniref:hypothetical protein n=1 Tax=Anaerobacillus sp. MEB173 TaxID=3383345 RepID=UPI003F8E758C
MRIRYILMIFLLIFQFAMNYGNDTSAEMNTNGMIITVKSTPAAEYYSELFIQSDDIMEAFHNAKAAREPSRTPYCDTYITLLQNGKKQHYEYDTYGNIYDHSKNRIIAIDLQTKEKLDMYIETIRSKHYGQFLPWEEAEKILPRKSIIEIIDIETGLRFLVQRRAGSNHADVQPLTRADTKIMKQIYNGEWSWNRRAILVDNEGQKVAASMHGMPHGKGAIPNGFPGHFCLHFLGSTTHGSKTIDLSHQVMVYKAAGKMTEFIDQANPYDIVDLFFIGLNHNDPHMLNLLYSEQKEYGHFNIKNNIKMVRRVSSFNYEQLKDDTLSIEIPVEFIVYRSNKPERSMNFVFNVKRDSYLSPWKLDNEPTLN